MKPSSKNLIWLDLEMTGLDPDHDHILEIATVITDKNLEVLAEGPVIAIHNSDAILEQMDEWNVTQHTKTGLVDRVKASKISAKEAQRATLEFISEYVPAAKSPMCGSSICQDRRFLYRYMPDLEKYFHYRNLDVSTLKIIAQNWYPHISKAMQKKSAHQALADIYDSIAELKYYRDNILCKNS